jgi:two-component system, NtrC family, nitrogen regulation sensor histidine kinase GlnL
MKFVPRSRVAPDVVLDGLTTAVICLDAKLAIASINSAGESLFEVSRRHAVGEAIGQAIPVFSPHTGRLRSALESGAGFIEREMELRRTGEPITVDCTVTPILLGKGSGLLMECLALDRHLRISRDELLLSQHQASRELIRGLAHEIKNPLGGIRGAAQLLEKELPDSGQREYTGVIIREADRLQNLVNRMLGPNRMPQKAPVNIHEVLEHVRQLCEAEGHADIHFLRDYDPSIPEIVADREQLIQAVLNVVRNAMQAIAGDRNEGSVCLRSRTRRQFTIAGTRYRLVIQIDVEDSGPGIAASIIDRIFYPMVTTRAEGTGLGLPMAQYLIHAHGGVIECRSRPGCTVFSMYLPLNGEAG